jgi:hypothetical protein
MLPHGGRLGELGRLPLLLDHERCGQNGYLSSRGGCPNRWHSLLNCDHGDSTTSRFGLTVEHQLLAGAPQHALLQSRLRDQPEDLHLLLLADAVCAVLGLRAVTAPPRASVASAHPAQRLFDR